MQHPELTLVCFLLFNMDAICSCSSDGHASDDGADKLLRERRQRALLHS